VRRNATHHDAADGDIGGVLMTARLEETVAILAAEHEMSPDGILVVNSEGEMISFNRRFVDMWSVPADVAASKSDERALASVLDKLTDPEGFVAGVKAIYADKQVCIRDEIALKDGRVFERHSSPLSSPAGRYLGRAFFFRDISARKRAEATIRFQADQYVTMLATTADGFGCIDTTGRHIDVNEAYCRMSGYSRAELLNLRVSDLEVVESPEAQARHIERVINNGFERFESRHRRKDGSVYDVEVSVSWWPEGGQLLFYCRDISERKRAEEALRNSTAMLATTERIAEIGGWDWDIPRNNVVWSDKLKHIFHVPADFVPTVQAFLDFTHPDDRARVGESIKASLKDNAPYDLEFRIVLPDQSEKVIHTQGEITRDPSGNPTRMFGTSQDVTRRAKTEHELAVNTAVLAAEHEASPDGILVVDKNGRIVSFNSRFTDIWKIPPELIESHDDEPVLEFVTRQNANPEAFIARVKHLYSHPNEGSFECLRLADGRSIDRHTAPMLAADGANLGRVWFFRDRTDQIRIENKLREDEAQFRALLEQSVAGIFIVKADGTIGYINRHFAEMAGYRVEEALGQPVLNFIDDAHKAAAVDAIGRLMSGAASSAQLPAAIVRKGDGLLDVFVQGTLASYQGHPAIIGVAVDITERNRAEAALTRTNRALKTLSGGNAALVRSASESELLHTMCNVAVETGGYRLAWIGFMQHDEARSVRPMAWAGDDPAQLGLTNVSWSDTELGLGPTGTAIRTGRPQINQSFERDPAMAPWRAVALAHGCHSSAALPLKDRSGTYGAFVIYAAEPDAFDDDEMKLLVEMAEDLSYGINSLRDRAAREEGAERLRICLDATVQAIASTLELRDPYTAGHQRNVAKIAAAIARDMDVPEDEIEGIYLAGVVHDIGKINVPSEILSKPGKLSKLEYMIVQSHAQAGYDIMKGVDFPWPVAQMILQHHERLDGSGYPNGLKGDAILPGAKIIAVADVVESMMAHRPYRPALGLDAALAEIEKNKARLYDERAVDACVKLMRSGTLSLG